MKPYLTRIAGGETLSGDEAASALETVMRGEASPEEIAGFLVGLAARGETLEELVAFVRVMRAFAVPIRCDDPDAVDLCGTGGDLSGTFNISTAAAFVCAGAGVTVVKHGNRSVSSRSGSADVLEALGMKVDLPPSGVAFCVAKTGFGFAFAPLFHPALRHVMPVRRALGVRTFFNIMGPLCNPAGVQRQIVGAFRPEVAERMARILSETGARHALTLHAEDGLDEVSLSGPTRLFEVRPGAVAARMFAPEDAGMARQPLSSLVGGSSEDNARIVADVLEGTPGPARDVVLLNAAHALLVSGRYASFDAALGAATESLDSASARNVLRAAAEASHKAPRS